MLPTVLASLSVAEEGPGGVWPLRSKQEHAGCVAAMKLCATAPAAVLRAAPLAPTLQALHRAAGGGADVLSRTSGVLLLGAATQTTMNKRTTM